MPPNEDTYNADELDAPEWLNAEFIKEVLDEHLEVPDLQVVHVAFSPASKKGDHYASLMFRAIVEYKTKQSGNSTISLIVKTLPEQEGVKKEMLDESHVFETEIEMYTNVLPKFERVLRAAGDETTFCTPCIYHRLKPRQIMVFEDLLTKGYSVLRRSANEQELKSALTKLAKWHAVSYKLLKDNPKHYDHLKYDMTTLPNMLEQTFMHQSQEYFIEMLGTEESLKHFQKYFEAMREDLLQRYVDVMREYRENHKENGLYVVCHGDFHLRNIMYKGIECVLLDFQMSYVGAMTNDIAYATYMLFEGDLQKHKSDELIYFYFQVFLETLKKIGYKDELPTLIQLRREMFEKRYMDFLLFVVFQPLILSMRKGSDAGELVENEDEMRRLYYQKDYQDYIKCLLPRLLHLGYFDQIPV